jgi:hypothetical protein
LYWNPVLVNIPIDSTIVAATMYRSRLLVVISITLVNVPLVAETVLRLEADSSYPTDTTTLCYLPIMARPWVKIVNRFL